MGIAKQNGNWGASWEANWEMGSKMGLVKKIENWEMGSKLSNGNQNGN